MANPAGVRRRQRKLLRNQSRRTEMNFNIGLTVWRETAASETRGLLT
jgi:hypothetical protein